ncbi:MAG: pyruvate, phosphate dikinase, partial [Firmicutes bacterium]|nr:pyruvate, phosphate dikinase [Bacillota bacterium]
MTSKKWVYTFEEGRADMKELLGGKGANLAEMTNIGLPVPPGITITTEACIQFYDENRNFPPGMEDQVREQMAILEQKVGKKFGDPDNPLLVSVRSGAVISMPGMMDTVLNLGLNDNTVQGLVKASGDDRFAMDCYRRFLNMFGGVVLDIEHHKFESILTRHKEKANVEYDNQLNADQWRAVIVEYKDLIQQETGSPFPQDPMEQLFKAVYAV